MLLSELEKMYSTVLNGEALAGTWLPYIKANMASSEWILMFLACCMTLGGLSCFGRDLVANSWLKQKMLGVLLVVAGVVSMTPAYFLNINTEGRWSSEEEVHAYEKIVAFVGKDVVQPGNHSIAEITHNLHLAKRQIGKAKKLQTTLELLGINEGRPFNMAMLQIGSLNE